MNYVHKIVKSCPLEIFKDTFVKVNYSAFNNEEFRE